MRKTEEIVTMVTVYNTNGDAQHEFPLAAGVEAYEHLRQVCHEHCWTFVTENYEVLA